ncbi:MAG: glycoside hydrolase family 31 protein [Clostridiales bacterium]|nr:glycoside hydrolase family 31 protein [Clostridiales bacterium]
MIERIRLSDRICRIRACASAGEPLLTRYGFLRETLDEPLETVHLDTDRLTLEAPSYTLGLSVAQSENGFTVTLPLAPGERLFGLGDECRDRVQKRGHIAQIKQANVKSYGPIPYLMSSRGWGILVNCTWAHTFDIGATDPDTLVISSAHGAADVYVFLGESMRECLKLYTDVSGKPALMPKSAYGLTVVLNEEATARTLLDDALRFRDRGIPCDTFGLEPSWMSKRYDYSTDKTWDPARFPFPSWQPKNYYGGWAFVNSLNRMGYGLSLWLCCKYDLFWKEEQDAFSDEKLSHTGGEIDDAHFKQGIRMDTVTKPGEDWFEHLKRFVDNGAEAFKLDGSDQVIPFPDRLWAGRYTDAEIRNLYPLVYARQMQQGYTEHTGRRAMIYTCGAYPGIQSYAATWAGDTGCNLGVAVSLMNYAMCAHTNASFDFTNESPEKIHFGFLAPWSQHQGWANWTYPWYAEPETEETYRYYARIRSSLFPYLYSYARVAYDTGMPILRPLCLSYPDTDRYDGVLNEYMLGDSLLVSVMDPHLTLPEEDDWYDFYTGERYTGPREFTYTLPENRGGAVFVRAGSIIVTQPPAPSLRNAHPEVLYVHVYPGKDADFVLYEDDYTTPAYENGQCARTLITLRGDTVTIGKREGGYDGMPKQPRFEIIRHG